VVATFSRRLCAAGGVLAAVSFCLIDAVPAGASAGTWSIEPSPNAVAPNATLLGVSCVSSITCAAVGYTHDSIGAQVTLAQAWNCATWTVQSAPNGVSCTSPVACTAVGSRDNSATLAERWDGTSWTIQSTPSPSSSEQRLLAVFCPSTSSCTAVGYYYPAALTQATLVEVWDGSAWSVQPSPNPPGVKASYLTAVSCSTAAACRAVGSYRNRRDRVMTLAERWEGSGWMAEPTPPQPSPANLLGLSCPPPSACTAVGSSAGQKGLVALAEAWNGSTWTRQRTPNATAPVTNSLVAVSCPSPTSCVSVGSDYSVALDHGVEPLAEAWNGSRWQVTKVASTMLDSTFSSVSCVSSTSCVAVGQTNTDVSATLAESWNGVSWRALPTPDTGPGSGLNGVSCTSVNACTAVGTSVSGIMAEVWDGTAWTVDAMPLPVAKSVGFLSAVSCPTSTSCTAVGEYETGSGFHPLAEGWDGTAWTIESTPAMLGTFLAGLSCWRPLGAPRSDPSTSPAAARRRWP
jgi:hypothetical protein